MIFSMKKIEKRRLPSLGKAFIDKRDCDLLECVPTEEGGWSRPETGILWSLYSAMLGATECF